MLQYLIYGVCLLILLSANHTAQGNETNELKVKNALMMADESLISAIALLEKCDFQYIPSNHTNHTHDCERRIGLKNLKTTLEKIQEAQQLYPIFQKSKFYNKPADCSEVLVNGNTQNGVYSIWPRSRLTKGKPLIVYCDMETDGGGWTVIQRRGNFSNPQNFYQDWEQYKNGFGDKEKDFWLGNDYIFALTNQAENEIRFDLQDTKGERGFAHYSTFWIDNEDLSYKMHISNYNGNVGDCMKHHNNMNFSTKDRGSTQFARFYQGGWWYHDWAHSNLNGRYKLGIDSIISVHWWYWRQNKGLSGVEIKIRAR